MKISALLFDLDGVITESSAAHFSAWKEEAYHYGIQLPDAFEDELKGISREESLDRILAFGRVPLSASDKQLFMEKKNHTYQEKIAAYTEKNRFEGVQELFDLAKQKGLKTALVSASKNAVTLLKALRMDDWFDAVVDPNKHPSKPAPDLFLAAAHALKVDPEHCIALEDAKAGIQAIKAAGMMALGIGEHPEADHAFPTLNAAYHHLKSIL